MESKLIYRTMPGQAQVTMPDWKQHEGEVADGKFPLERHLGGNELGAVFLTRFAAVRAAIKLMPTSQVQAAELVGGWNRAAALHHPHLAGILAAGTWVLAGTPVAYVVTEYAEENLAEVLRDRPLSEDEAREMLLPAADALAYLHGQGLVHGTLKPSNILAVGDTVKISSDAVSVGDPTADIRALGVTLAQALTQQADPAVEALPSPFREIAQNCLHDDSRLCWSADKIVACLRSPERPAPIPPASAVPAVTNRRRRYVPAVAAVIVGAASIGGLVMHRTAGPERSAGEPVRSAPAPARAGPAPSDRRAVPTPAPPVPSDRVAEPQRTTAVPARPAPSDDPTVPKAAPPGQADRVSEPPHLTPPTQDGITRRVLPHIPARARATVRGTARVVVRVEVDSAGRVTDATLEPGGSPYFGRLALGAARQWQFARAEGASPRNWILRFGITQTDTQVMARRVGRE